MDEKKLKLYLDNCCFNRPYDNQEQMSVYLETQAKLYIQENIKAGRYVLCWSYMLDYENNNNPNEDVKNSIQLWKALAEKVILPDDKIDSLVIECQSKGIKDKDAVHLACAIADSCDYFITTDKGILNKNITQIQVVNPIDFVKKEEFKDDE